MARDGGPERTEFERNFHRAEVARRYLRGETQASIGSVLGLSQPMVSIIVRELQAEWRESAARDTATLKAEQLAVLYEMEAELWKAWHASQGEQTTRQMSQVALHDGDLRMMHEAGDERSVPGTRSTQAKVTRLAHIERTVRGLGNAGYMGMILAVRKEIAALLGLNEPLQVQVAPGQQSPVSAERLYQRLTAMLEAAQTPAERSAIMSDFETMTRAGKRLSTRFAMQARLEGGPALTEPETETDTQEVQENGQSGTQTTE